MNSNIKNYISNIIELTETGQLKWNRRAASDHMYDCTTIPEHSISMAFDATYIPRISLTIVDENGNPFGLANINPNGEIAKQLFKLWDVVLSINLAKQSEKWIAALPELDKKVRFGPKEPR